jgi:hypothetical protein
MQESMRNADTAPPVQVTKRWFRCSGCGGRTETLARRFPGHFCDRCRKGTWEPCSMYGKRKVRCLRCCRCVPV